MHTFLDPSDESQFRIIFKSYNYLFGTTTTPSTSFSRKESILLRSESACLFLFDRAVSLAWGQEAYYTIVRFPVQSPGTTQGDPCVFLGETLPTRNLPREAQRPKCCLYEMPYNVAAPVTETGDIIPRTPLYTRFPTYAPTRTRIFFGSRVTRFSRDLSHSSTGSYVPCFQESHLQSQYHQRTTYAHETLIVAQRYDILQD